ncbi:MAG: hypothetical protein NTZ33_14685 [Bacteroidetes bacterium]|nr:hypothetical protein [Bacteroidota bacterium]
MSNNSENGHANNVAKLNELISYALSYGSAYNPAKAALKIAAMQTIVSSAKTANDAVNAALPLYRNAVDARESAFLPLSGLVRRSMNFLKASDTTDLVDESVNILARKLLGERATAKLTEEEKKALAAEGKSVKEISTSQMGYDLRIDNFDKFIKMLASIPLYAPNETDLKIAALTACYNDLKLKNAAVLAAWVPLSNARIARNEILYKEITGLHDLAIDAKLYIKSAFGSLSPQYKQISKLKFTNIR